MFFQKRKDTFFEIFFFQLPESFMGGRKEYSVYLANTLGERWKQANELANPGFFKEQRSWKLISKQAN